jgi:hypothetical protein
MTTQKNCEPNASPDPWTLRGNREVRWRGPVSLSLGQKERKRGQANYMINRFSVREVFVDDEGDVT